MTDPLLPTPVPVPVPAPAPVPDLVDEFVCRARGCGAAAGWGLLWNNPKLHTPERRKVWLACADHREHLEQFLGARDFLRGTVPVSELATVAGGATGASRALP